MIVKETWTLNETNGNHYGFIRNIDEEENNLDFCVEFYKKLGYVPFNKKYDEYNVLMTRIIDHNHTEFLGLILK